MICEHHILPHDHDVGYLEEGPSRLCFQKALWMSRANGNDRAGW